MRIVVTGSEGSLMQALIPKLLANGHEVVGIDNLYRYGKRSERAGQDYEFHEQDLLDRHATFELLRGADAVIHAAAKLYGVLGLMHYRADILGDDTAVCSNVLQAAAHHGVKRVVYMSSSMVYDSCVQDVNVPLVEDMTDSCPMPKTDYGLSKLVCERMCEAFRQQYGLEYTIWRPFNVVSPHEVSMTEQGFSHVLPDFINNIVGRQLNPLPIIGNGEQIRCFTWIDDVTQIIADHSFCEASANQVFNVCNVEPTRMKDAACMIFEAATGLDRSELEFETTRDYEHDVKVRIPSIAKLQTLLGPFEFVSTKESIRRCLAQV